MLSNAFRNALDQFSQVGPAECGVIVMFSSANSGWFAAGGSSTITSRPAAAIWPEASAICSARSSTTGPRQVLIRIALRFIVSNSRVLIMLRVASLRGTCSVTTSEVRRSSGNSAKRIPRASSASSVSRTTS